MKAQTKRESEFSLLVDYLEVDSNGTISKLNGENALVEKYSMPPIAKQIMERIIQRRTMTRTRSNSGALYDHLMNRDRESYEYKKLMCDEVGFATKKQLAFRPPT